MRTIIAGSRTIEDYAIVEAAVEASALDITEVVSGGQVSVDPETRKRYGADYFGEVWARLNGIPIRRFKADWKTHGKAAGPIRNQEMSEYAGALIAIRKGGVSSRGTTNMIDLARAQGLQVFVWEVEERSYWLEDRSGYITPDGEVVRLWNGPVLYGHRNSTQQQAQREIREQQELMKERRAA